MFDDYDYEHSYEADYEDYEEEDYCSDCDSKLATGYDHIECWGHVTTHKFKYCPKCN